MLPRPPAALGSTGWLEQDTCPSKDPWAAATHIGVPISKHLVEDMAELPAEDGAAGKWQTDGIGPEGEGPLFMVSTQNDAYQGQGQVQEAETQGEGRGHSANAETLVESQPPRPTSPPFHVGQFAESYGFQPWTRSCPSNSTGPSGPRQQMVILGWGSDSGRSRVRRVARLAQGHRRTHLTGTSQSPAVICSDRLLPTKCSLTPHWAGPRPPPRDLEGQGPTRQGGIRRACFSFTGASWVLMALLMLMAWRGQRSRVQTPTRQPSSERPPMWGRGHPADRSESSCQ